MKHIALTKGKFAQVDDADYPALNYFPWFARRERNVWYAARWERLGVKRRKMIKMHRLLCKTSGRVDHRDGNGLNNQRHNLRPATNSQNLANRGAQKNNTSGFKGVTRTRTPGVWTAQIKIMGRTKNLGRFLDKKDAARAYDLAARAAFGEFACLNFPN